MRFLLAIGALYGTHSPIVEGFTGAERSLESHGGIYDHFEMQNNVGDHHDLNKYVDYDGDYWDERRKLSSLTIESDGSVVEEYYRQGGQEMEDDLEEPYDDYIFDDKEAAFENLPKHLIPDDFDEQPKQTRRERRLSAATGPYESLCGKNDVKECAKKDFPLLPTTSTLDRLPCKPWSRVFDGKMKFTKEVIIPEDKCVSLGEFKDNEVIEFGDVVNIIGKLYIPDRTKVTLKFPMMYIQGKLTIFSRQVIDGDPDIKFILTGKYLDDDRYFIPHGRNKDICPAKGCLLGKNGIVVAGGQVLIDAMPDDCPTWTRIEYVDTHPMPNITLDDMPTQPILPRGCQETIIDDNFEFGLGLFNGNLGANEQLGYDPEDDNGFLRVANRTAMWHGPLYELTRDQRACMVANEVYYWSSDVRLTREDGNMTECMEKGESCPMLYLATMNKKEQLRWYKIAEVNTDKIEVIDGEWFWFTAELIFTEENIDPDLVFMNLVLVGPEKEVTYDIDNFFLKLPPSDVYPPQHAPCKELILNPNGGLVDGFTYPMSSWLRAEPLQIKRDKNRKTYYFIGPRTEEYSTITFDIIPACLEDSVMYKFTSKIWVHSEEPVRPRAIIKVHHPEGQFPPPYHRKFHFDTITICDKTSEEIGWITCEETIRWEWYHANSTRIQFLFLTQGSTDDVSYGDMGFTHIRGRETGGLKLPDEVYGCWGEGAGAFITSETIEWDADKVANISSVRADGMIELDVDEKFETPSSKIEGGVYTPEIAIMRRNVLWESEIDTAKPNFGGFFMVLKTPAKQVIQGVEIRNFGQTKHFGKYPINMYHGGSHNRGTRIAKNYIQDSNLRGIVLTGTRNINVTENVLYNIKGHGICMEEGTEMQNIIQYNLGARITGVLPADQWWSQEQDDRARFILIKNPKNHFIGNVATGSFWGGFWTQLHRMTHGESKELYREMNPQRFPMLTFKDNVAHSNHKSGFQFHPTYWWPRTEQVLSNTVAYRNMWFGMYFFGTENIHLKGGHFADNRVAIDLNYVDKVKVSDMEIIGYSLEYKDYVGSVHKKHLCWEFEEEQSPAIYGVRLHSNLMDHFHEYGTILDNVYFERLHNDTGCVNSKAIYMNPMFKDEVFSNKIEFKDISFDDDTPFGERFSVCDALDAGLTEIGIHDDGSMHPDGLDAVNGTGWIVSADSNMTRPGNVCVPMNDTCASYCVGNYTCLTRVTVEVEYNTDDAGELTLLVEDQDGYVRNVDGMNYSGIGEEETTTNWSYRRHFAVSLPQGNYTASFWRDGEITWPGFAEPYIVYNWMCDEKITSFDMIVPEAEPDECETLIRNGDMEKSSDIGASYWHDTNGGLEYVKGYYSDQAVSNIERTKLTDGISQFIDQRCLVVGDRWMISGKVMLSMNADCDPLSETSELDPMCPRFNIYGQYGTGIQDDTAAMRIGYTIPPWKPGQWNHMVGTFVVTPMMLEGNSTSIFVDGADTPELIMLDDVKTQRYDLTCTYDEEFIMNPNIQYNLGYWRYTGANTGIDIIRNREKDYGDGYSMTTLKREEEWHGIYQPAITDCLEAGKQYEVIVEYRMEEEDGEEYQCDPFLAYVLEAACPRPRLKWSPKGGQDYYMDIGYPVGPNTLGAWHKAQGVFRINTEIIDPTNENVQFFLGKAWPGKNIVMNSYSVKLAKPGTIGEESKCDNLVKNGDAETGNAAYWYIKGRENFGAVTLVSPGRDSEFAFYHMGSRSRHYMGMWQKIPKQCLGFDKWKVQAYFKLFDRDGKLVGCDKNVRGGKNRCPSMFFQGHTPFGGVHHTGPLWNEAEGPWLTEEWNEYSAIFQMDEDFATKDEIWFYVHNVLPGYTYQIDDISITRVPESKAEEEDLELDEEVDLNITSALD